MLATSSLKFKLTLISFLCLFPVTLVLGLLFYKNENELLDSKVQAALNGAVLSISAEVGAYLERGVKDGRLLATDSRLLEAIEAREFERVIEGLLSSIGSDFSKESVFLLDGDQALVATANSTYAHTLLLRDALSQMNQHALSSDEPRFIFFSDDVAYIVLLVAIVPKDKRIGWLGFKLNLNDLLLTCVDAAAEKMGASEAHKYSAYFWYKNNWLGRAPESSSDFSQTKKLTMLDDEVKLQVDANEGLIHRENLPDRFAIYASLLVLLFFQILSLSWVAQRLLLGRINLLQDVAKKFSYGDFSARVPISGRDEISDLGIVFNSMYAEISQAHTYLEKMVEVRTRQAEESMGRLEAILRSVGEAIISIDDKGRVISFNLAAEKIFGYAEDEMIGENVSVLMPYIHAYKHDKHLQDAAKKEQKNFTISSVRQVEGKRKSGELFPVGIHVTKGERNGKMFFIGAIEDLSEKYRAEIKLEKQQKLFETAIDNSSQPWLLVNPDGGFIKFNDALCRWLGYAEDELTLLTVSDITGEKYRVSTKSALEKMSSGDIGTLTKEKQYLRKDGTLVWGLLSTSSIKNDFGDVEMFVSQIVDIDESKRMAKALEERNSELERSNADLDQFAYIASHDLKSPLNAIKKIVGWIEEDAGDELKPQVKENVALIKNRTNRLMQLLNDLLLYSRVGRIEEQTERIHLDKLTRTTFDILDGAEGFRLIVEKAEIDVPKTPFELVIRNLLSNAIKHHDKGIGVIRVGIGLERNGYIIRVDDDGPGIPLNMQSKVLEMFQTLKPRDKTEGSGMGLALVKKTVEHYGGWLQIESDGQRGTTIVLHWPKKKGNS